MRPAFILATLFTLGACGQHGAAKEEAAANGAMPGDPTAPAGGWVDTVAETPEGGMRMGNPAARARLVEYGSFTCSHCAAFNADGMAGIRRMVASGRLSYEFRPFVRDSFDLAAALIARCGGPKPFFALSDALFARQQEWLGNAANLMPNDQKKLLAMPVAKQYPALAKSIGLEGFLGQSGVTPQQADRCLSDGAAQERLTAITADAGTRYKVDATPTFLLNGKVLGPADWAGLEPQLAAATGG